MPPTTTFDQLRDRIQDVARDANATALAVGLYDTATGAAFAHEGDRWFHAASTIKVPILIGVFGAIHRGELRPYSRLHVRNPSERVVKVLDLVGLRFLLEEPGSQLIGR